MKVVSVCFDVPIVCASKVSEMATKIHACTCKAHLPQQCYTLDCHGAQAKLIKTAEGATCCAFSKKGAGLSRYRRPLIGGLQGGCRATASQTHLVSCRLIMRTHQLMAVSASSVRDATACLHWEFQHSAETQDDGRKAKQARVTSSQLDVTATQKRLLQACRPSRFRYRYRRHVGFCRGIGARFPNAPAGSRMGKSTALPWSSQALATYIYFCHVLITKAG
jgi:hypothetical protein